MTQPHEHAAGQVGEPVEPLDDVVPEGVGDDDEDQDGLVPDDAAGGTGGGRGLAPPDVEQADHAADEDQEVGGAQVGARPSHPLDEEGPGQGDDHEQERIGDEDPEDEDQRGQRQPDLAVGRRRRCR